MRASYLIATAAVATLSATSAFAGPGTRVAGRDFITSPSTGGPEVATALSTGFESPFTPGNISGQQGYTVFAANTATTAVVSTASPFAGAQHLRLTDGGANGTLTGAFSPSITQPANDAAQFNVQMRISNLGGANYDVLGQAPTQSVLSFRADFDFEGNLFVLDFNASGVLGFVDTGVQFPVNTYFNFGVTFLPGGPVGVPATAPAGKIVYTINGVPVYTADTLVAGNRIEQLIFLSDNFQLANEFGDFDNVSVAPVPEPTSLGLLAVGGLALARRRRA